MAEPFKVEWRIGRDRHNRMVCLVKESEGGQPVWRLHREAGGQRDESADIRDLPAAVLIDIGKIVRDETKGRP